MNRETVDKFLLRDDLLTCDPYDIWKTGFGIQVKKLFYRNKYLGAAPAGFLMMFDHFLNSDRRWFYCKQEYPIVRALAALAMFNFSKIWEDKNYHMLAQKHLDWLAENYVKGYTGHCWGLSQRWMSKIGYYDSSIPHVTHTPYALEAFVTYRDMKKDARYDGIIRSVFSFLEQDIPVLLGKGEMTAVSYSPIKESRIVVNANAYVLYMYSMLLPFIPDKHKEIESKISRIYNFIRSYQNDDGSWFYYADTNSGNFIDCFHTCFVLKNLLKAGGLVALDGIDSVLEKGVGYLDNNFRDKKTGLYRRFSVSDKPSFVRFDLYDNAEVLNLAVLQGEMQKANELLAVIEGTFFYGNDIYSAIDIMGRKKNKNMLRWAVIPFMYAYSNYLSKKCAEY